MENERRPRGVSVRWLLLGVGVVILLFPVLVVLALNLYQNLLVRETEASLIAQSVLIGELWRDRWLEERGIPANQAPSHKPKGAWDDLFSPIEPRIGLGSDILPSLAAPSTYAEPDDGPKWRAGKKITPALERAKVFNLSSARVLDEKGCAVAASGKWLGACFPDLPEVGSALDGRYEAVLRERVSDTPKPPMASISRRGDVRVFTATPVFSGEEVIGAVWMSRTSMAPIKAAWLYRRQLLLGLAVSVFLCAGLSLFLAWTITRPLGQITDAAKAVARGRKGKSLEPRGFAPTEIHDLGEALGTMTRQLSDRADYILDFAANVSHELKSPITAIRGAAELLLEEMDEMSHEQRARFLDNIAADASRMERLVIRLLELAKIQSSPESANEIELVEFLEGIANSYDGVVALDARGAPKTINMNADHLESAVRNLLDNALRHGRGQRVILSARAEGDKVAISVADRGPGVSDANRKRIFDRFFTTERDRGGTGLGLAIVQAVAATRGGEVDLKTGPDGSTFTITV